MENKGSRNIDSLLDSVQFSLFRAFTAAGKPVLGICKGIQLINVAFGGTLIQDLSGESLSIHAWDEGDKIHITKAAHGTFPAQLYSIFRGSTAPTTRRWPLSGMAFGWPSTGQIS